MFHGLSVEIEPESLKLLQALKARRVLLLPNHPSDVDPAVMFEVSNQLKRSFYFVAAREVFNWEGGLRGWLFRQVGVYSVIRGGLDRQSYQMTQRTLEEGKNWLVIFIEGEMSRENDVLLPFQKGVIQIALRAQGHLSKPQEGVVLSAEEGIHLLPVAIRYHYQPGVEEAIRRGITRMEAALDISGTAQLDSTERLLWLGEKILQNYEERFKIRPQNLDDLDGRIFAVKNKILSKMEKFLELTPAEPAEILDRVRSIRNEIDRQGHIYHQKEELSEYEERQIEHLRETFHGYYDDLERVVNFLTIHRGSLTGEKSALSKQVRLDRSMAVLNRLEVEVFGLIKTYHPKKAIVRVAPPLLAGALLQTDTDKDRLAETIVDTLEQSVRQMLEQQ